jgi:hypothetical protein
MLVTHGIRLDAAGDDPFRGKLLLRRSHRDRLIVDYPTDAANRGGSCILIHIQSEDPPSGTAGWKGGSKIDEK